ncbi:MAG TPA: glycosyltransferase [Planctomycetaceae bacterium]|nr:glycosyltransferase [Planctomycetaceae bacterium]
MTRPAVLTFCDYYLPGYKAGGPLRTIANMVEQLGDEFTFRIVTRDRDLGDAGAFSGVAVGEWNAVGRADVLYLPPGGMDEQAVRRVLRETPHDVLYLNSFCSPRLTIVPLVLRWLGRVPERPVVLAPRGELAASALGKSPVRKRLYAAAARTARLFRDVIWQASSPFEADEIRQRIGRQAHIVVARDLPPRLDAGAERRPPAARAKPAGQARLLFLSRIHPVKNLDGALRLLDRLSGEIEFNVYGPLEDERYWQRCRQQFARMPANVRVEQRGSVAPEDVPRVMREHDLLLFPTRGENFGHVILESLIAGCPVLISDRTPWRNLAGAGVGWDLPLDGQDRFRQVLQGVIDMPADEHAALRDRAAAYGRQICRDTEALEQNRRLFHDAIGPARAARAA